MGEASDSAGLCAFELSNYKRLIRSGGVYACLVPITHIGPTHWVHRSIPPGTGQGIDV